MASLASDDLEDFFQGEAESDVSSADEEDVIGDEEAGFDREQGKWV